ncbi:aldehyde dehydrogenase family protein [Salinibacterium sp. SYSU T00001]|uniref:aldehyde dehydrogenase family protein n=1 Tax=Homoserinimonas sedimenticola TaxID=2986805 RepID=UPI0022354E99|nr:aldehyde dehydrogenase family protein [Salinibacterium sedimenticola]MCW4385600.1 aldehyde dehydrogenase family protein [Salinibacterium sedimenticola]
MTTTQVMTQGTAVAATSGTIAITDPRDGTAVGAIETTAPALLPDLVSRSRTAFRSWARVSPAERGSLLKDAAHRVAAREEELARLNERETGKLYADALGGVRAGVDTLLQYAELGPLHRGRSLRGGHTALDYATPEPRGVVAAITPWNDPVAVAAGILGAAIVSGNTVISKASEKCPHVGLLFAEIVAEALPDDVLIPVSGDGELGAALAASTGVDVIAHVGSTRAGESIARAAAATGAHVIRENGGNDALIIDADVDPEWAAQQAALGSFANAGQICTSVERIFVHADIAEAFTSALVAEAERYTREGLLGPLVDEGQRTAVHTAVCSSVEDGAVVACGGIIPEGPGCHYPATVLTECRPQMAVMREETFGPIAPVQVVASFEEGIARASDDRYGLAASVLTRSLEHAQHAAAELPVGTVKVNNVFGGAPGGSAQPRGASGAGFGYGPELLDEMTTVKVVHMGTAR